MAVRAEIALWDEIEDGGVQFNEPAIIDGVVYVGTGAEFDEIEGDGFLFAIDTESGEELWRYETGAPLRQQPAVAGDVVYAADEVGVLHAVDVDGEARWAFELDGAAAGSPAVVDGVVYLTAVDGSIYAITGSNRA